MEKDHDDQDLPRIKEVVGYFSGSSNGGNKKFYHINPFGISTLQLTESGVMSTGIREGDIIIPEEYIDRIKKL